MNIDKMEEEDRIEQEKKQKREKTKYLWAKAVNLVNKLTKGIIDEQD